MPYVIIGSEKLYAGPTYCGGEGSDVQLMTYIGAGLHKARFGPSYFESAHTAAVVRLLI